MADEHHKRPFWTSLAGVLTGLATLVTALTGVYLAVFQGGNGTGRAAPPSNTLAEQPAKKDFLPTAWEPIGEETFTDNSRRWAVGDIRDKRYHARNELRLVDGKYRWDAELLGDYEAWIDTPFGPATDMYAAVDVRFITARSSKPVLVGLLFGKASGKDYALNLSSSGVFALRRFDGAGSSVIIDWTPAPMNQAGFNRIAVAIEGQKISVFINSALAGMVVDQQYVGGKVGLSIWGQEPGAAIVADFDNFEYRRKGSHKPL